MDIYQSEPVNAIIVFPDGTQEKRTARAMAEIPKNRNSIEETLLHSHSHGYAIKQAIQILASEPKGASKPDPYHWVVAGYLALGEYWENEKILLALHEDSESLFIYRVYWNPPDSTQKLDLRLRVIDRTKLEMERQLTPITFRHRL